MKGSVNGMLQEQAYELLADQPAVAERGHVFVRLPIELQRISLDGNCACPHCRSRVTGRIAFWDTAVFWPGNPHVWLVHYPDLLRRPGESR